MAGTGDERERPDPAPSTVALSTGPIADAPTQPAGGAAATPDRGLVDVDPGLYARGGEIGRGGMGRIWEARDLRLGRPVAIKQVRTSEAGAVARFEREAVITARLQHPGIVPVYEAGRFPDGQPFYAMKRVDGRSLGEVIAEADGLPARMRLLRHVIAVTEALAYAHSQGVIHRDLKPANVLVGSFGETVVIDWGLAKRIAEPGVEEAAGDDGARDGLTVGGRAMGTPAYMPPEQAAGQTVTARADVYALGAMLYHVLAGRPPYATKAAADTLEEVLAGPPQPLSELVDDLPADLATIVARAMARNAEARYPTAQELAEELRRFEAGQLVRSHPYSTGALLRRFLRRHRAVVALATLFATTLAVTGAIGVRRIARERDGARRQREVALAQRSAAERLVDFMVFDLRDRLASVGRLDILGGVADKLGAYYGEVGGAAEGLDREQERRRSAALIIAGDVYFEANNFDSADRVYREAYRSLERLHARYPADIDLTDAMATATGKLADLTRYRGDPEGSYRLFEEALALHEEVERAAPDREDAGQDVAEMHSALSETAVVRGDIAGAQLHARAELAKRAELARRNPGDRYAQHMLATAHGTTARVLSATGDAAGARQEYDQTLADLDRLAAEQPGDADVNESRAFFYGEAGRFARGAHELATARTRIEEALEISQALVRTDPGNARWRGFVADLLDDTAAIQLEAGDPAAAGASATRSVEAFEELLRESPTNAVWRHGTAEARCRLGSLRAAAGRVEEALASYRGCLELRESLARDDPNDADWQMETAAAHLGVSDAQRRLGRPAEALAEASAARDIYLRLLAADPRSVPALAQLAESLGAMAEAEQAADHANRARDLWRAEVALLDPLERAGRLDDEVRARLGEVRTRLHAVRPR